MEAGSWKWEGGRWKLEVGSWRMEDALPVEAFLIDEALTQLIT